MKTRMKQLTLVLLALFFFAACNNAKKDKDAIKIGAILPLTGDLAFLGVPQKNAIELAKNHFNNSSKIKIDIIYGDNRGNAKESVTIINRMINTQDVKYFLAFPTGANEAIKPIIEKNNCLLLALSFYPPLVENTNNVVRVFYNADSEAKILTDYVLQKNYKNTKIAIIRSTDAVTEYETNQFLIPRLNKFTQRVFDIPFNVGQKDIRNIILKAKTIDPEILIILGFGSDFPNLLTEINYQFINRPEIIGGIGFLETLELIENKELIKDIKFVVPSFLLDTTNTEYQKIAQEYLEKYGTSITYDGIYAFDNIGIICNAFNNCPRPFSPIEIRKFIIDSKKYNGIVGEIEILKNGDSFAPQTLVKYSTIKNRIVNATN